MKQSFSPRELGRALGVSESSLKRWADEGLVHVSRTAGGHRRIMLDEAVRFIRQAGLPVVRPEMLGLSELAGVDADHLRRQGPDQALYNALLAGQAIPARGQIISMYLQGASIAHLCDKLIAPAMHRLGELWAHDRNGIHIEHRATDICVQAVTQLRTLTVEPGPDAPLALGATPSGDPYILPSMMSAAVVVSHGFREINLGPDMPIDVLFQAAKAHNASLVWLSVSVDPPDEGFVKTVEQLAENLAPLGCRLIVGGRGWPVRYVLSGGNAHAANSMGELAAYASGLLAGETIVRSQRTAGSP